MIGLPGVNRYHLLALLFLALDQLSKAAAQQLLVEEQRRLVINRFLELWVVYNPGAAFSMLSGSPDWGRWFLSIVAAGIALWFAWWLWLCPRAERLLPLALALLLGGGLGNLLDRLRLGQVVDFIALHYREHYFPVFNLADTCITLGVCLLLLHFWRTRSSTPPRSSPPPSSTTSPPSNPP